MISVEKAKELVVNEVVSQKTEHVQLSNCVNRIVAKDIYTSISLPPFRQSAMDGYAVVVDDFEETKVLELQYESKAGDGYGDNIISGKCVRVFTGAPVPDNATAVIMQEKTTKDAGGIRFDVDTVKPQLNIRCVGEQIAKGDLALPVGTKLNAGSVGFLASIGCTEVEVFAQPKIAIVVTGDELVQPGNDLSFGQIYESNSATLLAALQETGFGNAVIEFVKDELEATIDSLKKLQREYDFLIFTGGISVGDYDFTGKALQELGAREVFYKVKQKPGKPLYFGEIDQTYVFGLPGNPAAVLTCYYQYVLPALQKFSGGTHDLGLKKLHVKLAHDFDQNAGRALFLKAKLQNDQVSILGKQASSMLSSFTEANALLYFPDQECQYRSGDLVEVFLLP